MSTRELAVKHIKKIRSTIFDSGIGARLPAAYRKFYDEWRNTAPEPVHYIPQTGRKWVRNEETGEVKRHENVPLPLKYSKELDKVLVGGEAIVQGFVKKNIYGCRVPRFWVPHIYRSVVYSEIHDKYLSTLMTKRTVQLIHKHCGFDRYILETKACDLVSLLALRLKRSMLIALNNKDLPYSEEKNEEIYEKYKKYLIPPEEIEWYGLSFSEACKKQKEIEDKQKLDSIIPFKHIYRTQLIEELKQEKLDNELKEKDTPQVEKPANWLQKLPGFKKRAPES